MSVRASVDLELTPGEAFAAIADDLADGLRPLGLRLDPAPDGRVIQEENEVARVAAWRPGKEIRLEWHPAPWQPDVVTGVRIRFEALRGGTRVTFEHEGWDRVAGDRGQELGGWYAREVLAPLLLATSPARLADWITDRRARRPSGATARATYRDPIYHRPNFRAILDELRLGKDDELLDVGCGGGAFLELALRSGCRAAGVDHGPDMVRTARELNRGAITEGRLEILESEADRLPFPDGRFSCAVTTGTLGFFPDPVAVLTEIRRVLEPGGRFVLFTGSLDLRGTPAAPAPIASRVRFYEDPELVRIARGSGLADIRVERPDLRRFAREAGVPKEALGMFTGKCGQLLIARKPTAKRTLASRRPT